VDLNVLIGYHVLEKLGVGVIQIDIEIEHLVYDLELLLDL
jgi:hypothetical protein